VEGGFVNNVRVCSKEVKHVTVLAKLHEKGQEDDVLILKKAKELMLCQPQ
jgi:hypothetical protein